MPYRPFFYKGEKLACDNGETVASVDSASIRSSVCALDCPDACSLLVHVNAEGHGVKLQGNPAHPITRGFLCAKVTKYLDREYHPSRLLYPQRRIGSKGEARFERVSWEEAVDEIAARLSAVSAGYGSEAILPYSYGGTLGYLNGNGMDRRFFHRLGASRLDRTICATAGGEALMRSQGVRLGTEPEQFAQSKIIIAWGANILGTNVHLWPSIVEARRHGARFYVIDPVRNRTGRLADRHFPINPGSDLALALGMGHIILREGWHDADYVARFSNGFDEYAQVVREYPPDVVSNLTGLPVADIELLAREYATCRPSVIRVNYGVQRSDRGGSAVRAISALPVLTGAWREVGGGLQLSTSGAFDLNKAGLEKPELQQRSSLGREARLVNMSQLGEALTRLDDPPVKAMIVYNSNPAVVAPDAGAVHQGLRREDLFTVVLEHFITDTARYADFVLPATTFLEHTDLYFAYGHYYLQLARPALPAPGEARSNVEIFRSLALRMGFEDDCFQESEDDMLRALLDTESPYCKGITLERLDREKFVRLNVSPEGEPFLPFAQGGFRTSSGRYEFDGPSLRYTPAAESRHGEASFPFELISAKNDDSMNSTFGFRSDLHEETSVLSIHPADAAARHIRDDDAVRLFNARGECELTARLSTDVQPGVLSVRSMSWNHFNGRFAKGINQLTSQRLTDLGGGATFFSCLVDIERADSASSH